MIMQIFCSCGKKAEVNTKMNTLNIGKASSQTGFRSIFTDEGKIIWLCDDCFLRAHKLAIEILKIVKNEYFYFPDLLKS